MRRGVTTMTMVSAVALALAGCGGAPQGPSASGGFPMTVSSCGHDVQVQRRPERVVALGPSEVETLSAAGGASRLVARDDAGAKSGPYPADLKSAVATVPQLGTGGEVTRENVIAASPDLVVGSVTQTITTDSLEAVDIPLVSLRGNCGSNHAPGTSDGTSDFDDVFSDVDTLGRLLGTQDQASAAITSMRQRIAAARPPAGAAGKSVAAAIVFKNGLEIYGRRSMAHTQFQALGLRDVFADADSRVFDANVEELIARNPDMIVLLSYGKSDQDAKADFLRLPGVGNLTAVRSNALYVQPYEFSSQGTLAVDGLETMAKSLGPRS